MIHNDHGGMSWVIIWKIHIDIFMPWINCVYPWNGLSYK